MPTRRWWWMLPMRPRACPTSARAQTIVAWRGDFARFDECLAAVRPAVRDDRYVDKDLALCCEWAGDRCAEKPEHRERAIACYQLALKQLQQLQDMERAGQVAARLSALVGASRGATAD